MPEAATFEQQVAAQRDAIIAQNPEAEAAPAQANTSASGAPAQNLPDSESASQEATPGDGGGTPEDGQTPAPGKGKNWAARKIDQLTRERAEANQQAATLARALERVAGGQPAQQQPGTQPAADPGPQRAQYAAYEDFLEARAEWKAQRIATAQTANMLRALGQHAQAAQATQSAQRIADDFQSKLAEGSKQFADFDDVVAEAQDLPVGHAAPAIAQSDNPAALIYWLGKPENRAAANKLSTMTPMQAAIEVGRISASLKSEPAISAAPKPGKPANVRGGTPGGIRDDMSMDDFVRARRPK
jgi:hypothetical protein